MRVRVDRNGVRIKKSAVHDRSYDVCFNGRRVWSFTTNSAQQSFSWPPALKTRLYGQAHVELKDSESGITLASEQVHFDRSDQQFELVDEQGAPLMLNKWLRLAPVLVDAGRFDHRNDLVRMLAAARDDLWKLGYKIFAVGGTALGPYRDGDLLPHDDDGDLAIFFDTEFPVEVARGMLQVERELRSLGYRVRPHSHAHLQVYPPEKTRVHSGLYFDVFAAFLKDHTINQPFHVRGPFTRSQLLPFREISVRGEQFPVPNDTEEWLATNYDRNWRSPQPGFQIITPLPTIRRFQSWFGTYNLHRHFWDLWASTQPAPGYRFRGKPLPRVTMESQIIVNAGSGRFPILPQTVRAQAAVPSIVAIDYSDRARELAAAYSRAYDLNISVRDVNLANFHSILTMVADFPRVPFDVYSGFAIEGLNRSKRLDGFWRLVRLSLKSGGKVVIDLVIQTRQYTDPNDPLTAALTEKQVQTECRLLGLEAITLGRSKAHVAGRTREVARIQLTLTG